MVVMVVGVVVCVGGCFGNVLVWLDLLGEVRLSGAFKLVRTGLGGGGGGGGRGLGVLVTCKCEWALC